MEKGTNVWHIDRSGVEISSKWRTFAVQVSEDQ